MLGSECRTFTHHCREQLLAEKGSVKKVQFVQHVLKRLHLKEELCWFSLRVREKRAGPELLWRRHFVSMKPLTEVWL